MEKDYIKLEVKDVLGRWSRDSENFLWFTLKEEKHE